MSHSGDEQFKNREHIVWEIAYCGKATNYITYLSLAFMVIGSTVENSDSSVQTRLLVDWKMK